MKENALSFPKASSLVARALGISAEQLRSGFRAATTEDLPAILDVRRRVIGDQLRWDDAEYLRWRYAFGPDSKGRGSFLVVAHEQRVLGMIGTEDLTLAHGDQTCKALSAMDIMVDPELDGTGLGIWLNMAIFAKHPLVIEIGANPNSLRLISQLFHRLPDRKEYFAPLRFSRFFSNRVRMSALAELLALPANAVARLWRAATYRPRPADWFFHDISHFGRAVEDLFLRRWAPQEITIVRDTAYLNWRLFRNPRARYSVFGAYANGDLVGYAAYQTSQRADGLKFVSMVDWLVDDRFGIRGFEALVREMLNRASSEGADFANVTPLHARSERSLFSLGFVVQGSRYNTVGIRCSQSEPWPELLRGDAWFLTEANTDRDGIA